MAEPQRSAARRAVEMAHQAGVAISLDVERVKRYMEAVRKVR